MHASALRWRQGLVWFCTLVWCSGYATTPVPADKQADVLLKVLASDRNLKVRSGDQINIAVLHKNNDAGAAEIAAAFQKAGAGAIAGLPVSAASVPFASAAALMKQIASDGINVIYVDASLVKALSSVTQVTRGKKIPSLCGSRDLLEKGLSIGVYESGATAKILINLRAAKVEGMKLKAEMLSIAEVIK